jgi:hypothetical protein
VLPSTSIYDYQNPSFVADPYYWVTTEEAQTRLPKNWKRQWLIAFKDVTSSTNERTFIGTVIPRYGVGNNMPLLFPDGAMKARSMAGLVGNLSSLVFDYLVRHKVGGLHLNFFIVKQLVALPPTGYADC